MKFSTIIALSIIILSLDETNCLLFKKDEICFKELNNECFTVSKKSVWYDPVWRPISLLPDSPSIINVKFSLYTKLNSDKPEQLRYDDIKGIIGSIFNADNPTVFIVHGYIDGQYLTGWMQRMKNAYLEREDSDRNVIIVEWSPGNLGFLEKAIANTRVVGAIIAAFIRNLITMKCLREEDIHLVGHSLGGQIIGYVGKRFNTTSGNKKKIGRITSLDPCGPYFANLPDEVRLVANDAKFVDVYHTNAADPPVKAFILGEIFIKSIFRGLGIWETSGHVDFYINGGKDQVGCGSVLEDFKTFGIGTEAIVNIAFCNHFRAVQYFISSIKDPNCFELAKECDSFNEFKKGKNGKCGKCKTKKVKDDSDRVNCVRMGEDADSSVKLPGKKLWVLTSSTDPYCYCNQ